VSWFSTAYVSTVQDYRNLAVVNSRTKDWKELTADRNIDVLSCILQHFEENYVNILSTKS